MKRFFSGLVLWLALIATYGTSVFFQNMGMQRVMKYPSYYDTWQLGGRSGELMKLFALRYDMVAADFLWLRSIQSFGGRGMTNRDWRPVYNQFDTITDLDPYFADAYTFGNLVIGDEGGHLTPGLDLLHKGTFNVYRQYRVPFEAMYVAHWQMENEKLARWYGVISSLREDAPEWVTRMVAYVDVNSGEYYIGLDRFVGNLMQGIDADEPTLQSIALTKAAETIHKWNASILAQAADEFTSSTGRAPNSIQELANMPALQNYETASLSRLLASTIKYTQKLGKRGVSQDILNQFAPPDRSVLAAPAEGVDTEAQGVSMADLQDVVFQDSLTTITGLPPSNTGQPYMINFARLGRENEFQPEEIFVPLDKLHADAIEMLSELRSHIARRKGELGRNPASLEEVFFTEFKTPPPLGGEWIYNPETGEVTMSSEPGF